MPQVHTMVTEPEISEAPADLQDFLKALAAKGISATLPTARPDNRLLAPLAVRTSLSAAVLEERSR